MAKPTPCIYCAEDCDYICERCLRCEKCDAVRDRDHRAEAEHHRGRWLWHRNSLKGVQLVALATTGAKKGDWDGPEPTADTDGSGEVGRVGRRRHRDDS